ncbi:hypothetical protein [Vibrio nigripulchritudo]|uniref:hypothetical protein n=1 Tax=Vibrio nigripulchritudo TaxID=28173 RepID=UPI0003B24052|nr:hypothetical protein [Vibrio nigripulchritudo]CCN70382.1 exported hypothetical protein [Vibrio nigripulchritudo SFn118]
MKCFKLLLVFFLLISISVLSYILISTPDEHNHYARCAHIKTSYGYGTEQENREYYEKLLKPWLEEAIGKELAEAYPETVEGIINKQFLEHKVAERYMTSPDKLRALVSCLIRT